VQRFRGGLVFQAHRLVYHSTLGWRVKKKKTRGHTAVGEDVVHGPEQQERGSVCHAPYLRKKANVNEHLKST